MSINDRLAVPEKLDSELLRTFLAVADAGSVSGGAERILRSQSAASLQIKRLESLLGVPVFERHARGVSLTATGEKLRPLAQRVVDLLDAAIGDLRSEGLEGSLRIGVPDEYGEIILPKIIARFARHHPRVELAVRCGFSADFPAALSKDELDLAVHAVEAAPPASQILLKEKTYWVGARSHSVHEQDPLPIALFDRACWWRDRALQALEAAGRRYRVIYTSESVTGVAAAIEAGVAVGLLGESSLRDGLRPLLPADGFPRMPDSLLVLETGPGARSSVGKAMAATIVEAFGRQVPRRHS
ncbi:LysR family transcriptional regulator [Pelagibius litoralis]|uniref:LysR family transcriptional regulator n=1 Tax=Pelagibius litoralis TaxID=374515 RepID=A0A967F0N9_9PROT|nr:LysR substrate-binding domain-containing protein [Pelagibius litoralis]NIA70914.1 LysR family transcriptional regulator [Pelagibius litoralis]